MGTRFDHTDDGYRAAREEHTICGGYLLDDGDCYWITQDEGTAEDLVLHHVDEDRAAARRYLRRLGELSADAAIHHDEAMRAAREAK